MRKILFVLVAALALCGAGRADDALTIRREVPLMQPVGAFSVYGVINSDAVTGAEKDRHVVAMVDEDMSSDWPLRVIAIFLPDDMPAAAKDMSTFATIFRRWSTDPPEGDVSTTKTLDRLRVSAFMLDGHPTVNLSGSGKYDHYQTIRDADTMDRVAKAFHDGVDFLNKTGKFAPKAAK